MTGDEPSNPYAPPAGTELAAAERHTTGGGGGHYRMSTNKLAIMSLLTLGLYDLAFFWRHWRAVRNTGENVSVFARTLFSPLFCFGLCWRLERGLTEAGLKTSRGLRWAATLYLVLGLVARLADVGDALAPPQLLLVTTGRAVASLYPLVSIQSAANRLLDARGDKTPSNDGIGPTTVSVGLFGLILWALMLVGAFAEEPLETEPGF